ncbi:MAG: THxN family PEP-CTERM protein [Pseudomonadota bacterium]
MSDERKKNYKIAMGILLACLMPFGTSANAAVITWNYAVESVFTGATPTGPGDGFVVTPSEISWGDPMGTVEPGGGRSAIAISNSPRMGQVDTNGPAALANTFSHANDVVDIDLYPQLLTADILTTVTLTPANPPSMDTAGPMMVNFVIRFVETLNEPNNGICPVGSIPCQDIFVIESGALDFPFSFDGEDYFISVFEETNQLNPLPLGACMAAGAGADCIGFLTEEDTVNIADFAFVITQQIPEPATLLLFAGSVWYLLCARRAGSGVFGSQGRALGRS